MLGQIHLLSALIALTCGAGVLLRKKGTTSHRGLGYAYISAMLALNATALGIYRLFHRWGPFHWLALASLATIGLGVFAARHRRAGWRVRHARFMAGSYIGLVAAAASEIAVRVPLGLPRTGRNFALLVFGASLLILGVGFLWLSKWLRTYSLSEQAVSPQSASGLTDRRS